MHFLYKDYHPNQFFFLEFEVSSQSLCCLEFHIGSQDSGKSPAIVTNLPPLLRISRHRYESPAIVTYRQTFIFLHTGDHLNQFCLLKAENFDAKLCCLLLCRNEFWLRKLLEDHVCAGLALRGKPCVIGWFDGALFCVKGCPELEVPFPKLLNLLIVIV